MANTVRDVMTPVPVTIEVRGSLADAAEVMRVHDVGDVLVTAGTRLHGILTDRDIVVRAVAPGLRPVETIVGDFCSTDLHTVHPDDSTSRAVALMRHHALRRLPVLEDDQLVGVVSLGDLAVAEDPKSALADISAAPPNR